MYQRNIPPPASGCLNVIQLDAEVILWNEFIMLIEGKIKGVTEVTRRLGRRRNKLLDDLKDMRGYSHLKEEALDHTVWRNRFGRDFGPVVRQNTE
jgi:hypothetical protein